MIPQIPNDAPFTVEQITWLNQFFAGLFGAGGVMGPGSSERKRSLLILFGSQSGNAETLAKKVGREASARGFAPRVAGLDSVSAADLAGEPAVLLITSTWGEGDMPDNAVEFWDGLNQNGSSPNLSGVQFSVLALGDRNYGDTFCLAGKKIDQRLTELGANRLIDRVDCDVEYETPAAEWLAGVFEALGASDVLTPNVGEGAAGVTVLSESEPAGEETYSKKNPLSARLIANVRLNGKDSAKDTRHIAFSLEGSGLSYEVGDALGVFPANCPDVVARVMESHRLDPDAVVPLPGGGEAPLRVALETRYEVRGRVGGPVAGAVANPVEFVEGLRRLQPRLYSIASSLKAHPGEVHLCVGRVEYVKEGVTHKGVCSTFLADRLEVGAAAEVFVQRSPHFRLPADPSLPVVMIGPGTGIAPFRAFLEERAATGATGRNWLFFGDQHAASDFLYRDEMEALVSKGILHRLDTAFSRDQARKIYVQNRMMTQAMELFTWLEHGAHVYVCGDASRMAKDVETALHQVLQTIGGKTAEGAAEYVARLKKAGRYQRDVY